MGTSTERQPRYPVWVPYAAMALLALGLYLLFYHATPPVARYEVPYSQFKGFVRHDQVVEVELQGSAVHGRLRSPMSIGPRGERAEHFSSRLPSADDQSVLSLLEQHGVTVSVARESERGGITTLLLALLPWVVLLGFFYWAFQRTSRALGGRLGGPNELKKFLEAPAKRAQVPKVTFADVAGQDNAKREVTELVEYLKRPDQFRALGAEIPRGVLLMGAPGTGKTLLARALAGEAGVPFYSISGSEFIEVFVGVGASRVRNLFQAAKANAPSIIFIDELDSVGRTRGTGLGGGHDEREQTLNQILAELDGFEEHEAVIVLAATNRPDVLDPALLRPGRFDRHVTLDLPDRRDRLAILQVHTRRVPLAADVDLNAIAGGTPGFSGADLRNLVNEAAILAGRGKHRQVAMADFDEARDKLLLGTVRTLAIQDEERHRLAVHEAGHTLVAFHSPHADPLYKVTIIPRGRALGGTQQLPVEERHTLAEDYLRARLAVMLAGRCAERELLGTVSSGADDDIRQATALARAMVSRWGMSGEVGPVDLRASEEHPFLGREIAQPRRFSEHSAQIVDQAVSDLLAAAEAQATALVAHHRAALDRLVAALEQQETLEGEAIERCLTEPPASPTLRFSRTPRDSGATRKPVGPSKEEKG